MDGSIQPAKSRLARVFGILAVAWLLLSVVSTFVLVSNSGFIPSAEWTAETHLLRIFVGLLFSPLLVWAAWQGGKRAQMSELKRIVAVSVSPFFGYWMGSNILFIWPILLPLFAGHQVALPLIVLRATDFGGVRCPSPVVFEQMPFAHQYCSVPENFRLSLSPGKRIVAVGWGTRYGVYARELRLNDAKGPRIYSGASGSLIPRSHHTAVKW